MIHTIQLYTKLSFEEKDNIENRFKKTIEEVMKDINIKIEGISFTGVNRKLYYQIYIVADIPKILNRGDICENDYWEVKKAIDEQLEHFIGY